MKLTDEGVNKHFMDLAMKDPKKVANFIGFQKVYSDELIERFGKDFKWEEIPFRKRTFRGWLRPLLIISDSLINGRWPYWLNIRATQEVEGKEIPQINFYQGYDDKFKFTADMIRKCLNPPNMQKYGSYKIFHLFIDWLLYGLGSSMVKKMPLIDDALNEYWYRNFKANYLLMFPADYFVRLASELYSSKAFNSNAFYPTPDNVVKMMIDMTFDSSTPEARERNKYAAMNEPCCGSGIFLLYTSNHTLRLYAQDIDRTMVKLATLNSFFYIPWMVDMDEKTSELLEKMHNKYYSKGELVNEH